MKFVIVESPTKAKTISKFLGDGYIVESSYGHVRDLPRGGLGVDLENNFEPKYVIPRTAQPRVTKLKKAVSGVEEIILATDEDREGEAIAWHLTKALGLKLGQPIISRIVFHEITQSAIEAALEHPRDIDMQLVDAQQARRVLDRLVGYKLSPFLWKKIAKGLSAGRVQSVALRLVVDRENEIKNFKSEEYWTIAAILEDKSHKDFLSNLVLINNKPIDKFEIKNETEAKKIVKEVEKEKFQVKSIEKKEIRKNPPSPFITSTLQQEAAKRLKFSAKKTMMLAQNLYENGFITYMRTDSVNLSTEFLNNAKDWIASNLGEKYAIDAPRVFKKKSRLAQEAHEAIRPTNVGVTPEKVGKEEELRELYELIWSRAVASQMPQAVFDATTIDISADKYTFRTNGNKLRFDGFLKIWLQKFEEAEAPSVSKGDILRLVEIKSDQHFTEPPPRFNEASLIKALEGFGIGRPSTYAPTISTIQERNYCYKQDGKFYPTEIGEMVTGVLKEHFPDIVDFEFTARMEEDLDEVAEGKEDWRLLIKNFYDPFSKNLEKKYSEVESQKTIDEETNEVCEKCGKKMLVKRSRFGKFLGCSGYPECKTIKKLAENEPKKIGLKCPKCIEGEVIEKYVRRGRSRGKMFWGCSRYPACDYASWTNPMNTGETHPSE